MVIKRFKNLEGGALIYGLVIMAIVQILLVSIIQFITTNMKYSLQIRSREQSLQIAEAGVEFYRWYLAHNVEGKTTSQIETFWSSGSVYGVGSVYEADYTDPSGTTMGRYRLEVTPPVTGSTIAIVKSTGWTYRYPAQQRILQVRLRRPSWSENAVLANDFTRFGVGTEVYGKIHSNAGIRFDGLAHNVVTSSVATYNDPDHTGANEFGVHTHKNAPPSVTVNDAFRPAEAPPSAMSARTDVFEAGRQLPVTTKDFNGVLGDLSVMKTAAQATSSYYSGAGATNLGTQIILRSNGTYDTCRVNAYNAAYTITRYTRTSGGGTCGSCSGLCLSNRPIPDNGVIFVEDNAWISGTINDRKVTIAAADLLGGPAPSVYILNDIRYTNTDGRDIIGIIGQNNIEIGWASESDLRIDAALLAQQGRVGREHYTSKGYTPDTKTVITVYGAIATNLRYGFAWTDGTGYTTRNLYYDNNLLYYPPPYFPTGTQYELDLWEEL